MEPQHFATGATPEQFALPLGSGDMHQRASAPAPFFPDVNAVNQQGAQFFNNMAANPITQMGLAYGQNYLQNSKVGSWFSVDPLKYYFNVNNSYVYNKLRIILFPWLHKTWKRQMVRKEDGEFLCPPRDDINAPDLYIPFMAFVTYTLLVGFVMGTDNKFTPEVLGNYASRGLLIILLEVGLIKAGLTLLFENAAVPFWDLVAYCGYAFVLIALNVAIGRAFGGALVYYVVLCIASLHMSLFMVRTLRLVVPSSQALRNPFLLSVAGLQFLIFYFLGVSLQ